MKCKNEKDIKRTSPPLIGEIVDELSYNFSTDTEEFIYSGVAYELFWLELLYEQSKSKI